MADSDSKPEKLAQLWSRALQRSEGHRVAGEQPAFTPEATEYEGLFVRAAGRLKALRRSLQLSEEEALRRADALIGDPEELRDDPAANAPGLPWSPAVVGALLRRAKEITSASPEEGIRCAHLALQVAWRFHLDPSHDCGSASLLQDLRARALAHKGNALRLLSRYAEAEEQFRRALPIVARGSGDPLAEAEIRHFHGSLLRDRRHFPEARRALRRASYLYAQAGQRHEVGKVLFNRALTERELGHVEKAIRLQRQGLQMLDLAAEPQLEAAGFTNLAMFLTDIGRAEEAQHLLDEHPLGPEMLPRWGHHRIWIEGRLAALVGDRERAADLLDQARRAFATVKDGHHFATATVDLAAVYAEQGDFPAVRQLVSQSLQILNTLDVPRDAIAAFLLFQQAAAAEALGSATLGRLRSRLGDQRLWSVRRKPS